MIRMLGCLTVSACLAVVCATASANDSYFDSAGVKIRYVIEGTGSPVLLIHGYTGNLERAWRDRGIFGGLVAAGYRVIAFDHRGHGKSDWPSTPSMYGVEMVNDARRLLDHLEIERAHIVGYSMGGKITTKFGELYPERVLSLTLGGIGFPFFYQKPQSEEQVAKRLCDRGREGELSSKAIAALTATYADFLPSKAALRAMEFPTLIIIGDNDMGITPGNNRTEGAKTLSTIMTGSKLVVVPGNHREAASAPEFLSGLLDFLASQQ